MKEKKHETHTFKALIPSKHSKTSTMLEWGERNSSTKKGPTR
jgi:hypothetical protein